MEVPKYKTVMGSKAISVRGPKFWNDIPKDLKETEKYSRFSNAYKSHITQVWDNHPT